MKVLFMGTPDFAVPSLEALINSKHEVIGVVTQPDRPKGRGKKIAFSPVKEVALKNNLPLYQPQKIKNQEFYSLLNELKPDSIVVVAFGQLLSKEILEHPPYGCINVHGSLLPKYRGAAPIHWAIMEGEKETGVTTMYMDIGLDTGDMIFKASIPIDNIDTTGEVHDKLALLGAEVLISTLLAIEEGSAPRIPQEDSKATYASLLTKEHEIIYWSNEAGKIVNQIRGMNPWPGVYTTLGDKRLKIRKARVYSALTQEIESGKIFEIVDEGFVVQTGKGLVLVTEVQLEGSKPMDCVQFLRGNPLEKGLTLGKKE